MASIHLAERLPRIMWAVATLCCAAHGQESQAPRVESVPRPPDKHMFGVLPNYRTADDSKPFRALAPKQKFQIALHDSFDPPGYFIAAGYTLIYHLENTNPEFGQGVKGYSHRYATTYADQMLGNMMTEGVMPSLLHEDPRYYRRGHGSFPVRLGWAVSRIFVTRTDRNTYEFNYSEFTGNAISGAMANAYYPANRKLGDDLQRLQMQLTSDAISNCLKEFWPDLKKWFRLGRHGREEPLPFGGSAVAPYGILGSSGG
jgi:hypothetical protein